MQDQKNILIALLVCVAAWMGFQLWLKPAPLAPKPLKEQVIAPATPRPLLSRDQALKLSARLPINTACVQGSLALKGALIDDWILREYKETSEPDSSSVSVLSPWPAAKAYYAAFRWYASSERTSKADGKELETPSDETFWETQDQELTDQKPVTLQWRNAQGILFQQILSIDHQYLLSIKQIVTNESSTPIVVGTQSFVRRYGPVPTAGYMMLHEGPLGVFSGRLKELSYTDTLKAKETALESLGKDQRGVGWLGITDKYWLAALIPSKAEKGEFGGTQEPLAYQAEKTTEAEILMPGQSQTVISHLFVGPKKLALLEQYERKLGINHFDLAVDFGWFYFLTRPMFALLSWLKNIGGSFGFAILAMTVLIKLAFFPLSLKSYKSMARMRKLQPQLQSLKERYGNDQVRLNQEIMNFYRKEKINPVSGCLPMLIQIPIFFALYKVLFVSIEMRQAPFLGWINDLAAPDPTSLFNAFGLLPWTLPQWLHIGIWPLLMGVTMVLQQRINTTIPLDPQQKFMFTYIMPILFMFMLGKFPVGLVIYWTWSNLLTILQQWFMMRYYGENAAGR